MSGPEILPGARVIFAISHFWIAKTHNFDLRPVFDIHLERFTLPRGADRLIQSDL